jgi:hypothetical protein
MSRGPQDKEGPAAGDALGARGVLHPVAGEISQSATGYAFGNLLTSLIAGVVIFVTLTVLGVPFPLLWALWVALVDFLPMIGGALAGIPAVLFALGHSLTAPCHRGRVHRLSADRKSRTEPRGHEPNGQRQSVARSAVSAGRNVDR